ncbi:hypothetical protein B0T22DRAFT_222283 [Podospora appendiculata]|uniref:dolichol kinase n=1 Tax=Podospora appendiculata TaxID=314037 RepID=A0AAE0X5N2_9PEZI|nr:hypothetical protein B0T22DRAFT_222283 [Podospora appendiculata]
MPEHLNPPTPARARTTSPEDDHRQHGRRIPSRSPHPYHRQSTELLEPSGRLIRLATATQKPPGAPADQLRRDSPPPSESGTEADDEHFLKGLPAPKTRLHKGLRGKQELLSASSTPSLSPAILEEEGRRIELDLGHHIFERDKRGPAEQTRRRKEFVRRAVEVLLLVGQGVALALNGDVQHHLRLYKKELCALGYVLCTLAALYPLRLVVWAYRREKPSRVIPIRIPASFDPAPALYPPLTPAFVSLLVAQNVGGAVPLNLVLSLCALPRPLIPGAHYSEVYSTSHWLVSCIPILLEGYPLTSGVPGRGEIPREILVLLYPLHQTSCLLLQHLTTTSLLVAEIQLLSVALINIILLAHSPQVVILKGVLWGGGLALIILCSRVIQWGIALARVPKWRFKKVPTPSKAGSVFRELRKLLPSRRPYRDSDSEDDISDSASSTYEYTNGQTPTQLKMSIRTATFSDTETMPGPSPSHTDVRFELQDPAHQLSPRRNTLPSVAKLGTISKATTPSGRRKRSASSSVRAFFSLTHTQAAVRKWAYAAYVYLCILATVLIGIREYVRRYALKGNEPIGWALGYLFGDLPRFRFEVVKANLERWICLPVRSSVDGESCHQGWVQHVRLASFGEANTRLLLSAYWAGVIVVGLAIVMRLSPIYEVDTRRKVFHFMMVAMFLPTTFIDPTYIALALSLVLAIFLLLDLLRASQLPPLSKPIARFLTPYVDGRDLRGPVVISHIFLLIGCAIPLWLSLASLPRVGAGALEGWDVPTRDVSMVSGVVCVGLGDAAASLIGRRWGRTKWFWGGGKSIEGSVAFAVAVFLGLMAANMWLRVGGWPLTTEADSVVRLGRSGFVLWTAVRDAWVVVEVAKITGCATLASLTEAVLTGGNDNVVVPVVLWTCVKSVNI